jgi:hypothetical protein
LNLRGDQMTRGAYLAIHLFPAAFLVGAIGPWPYGYFTLLRFVVCIAALWLAYLDYQLEEKVGPWVLALGVAAILFNPIIPVHLTRDIWFFLDLGMAALLGLHFVATRPNFER